MLFPNQGMLCLACTKSWRLLRSWSVDRSERWREESWWTKIWWFQVLVFDTFGRHHFTNIYMFKNMEFLGKYIVSIFQSSQLLWTPLSKAYPPFLLWNANSKFYILSAAWFLGWPSDLQDYWELKNMTHLLLDLDTKDHVFDKVSVVPGWDLSEVVIFLWRLSVPGVIQLPHFLLGGSNKCKRTVILKDFPI